MLIDGTGNSGTAPTVTGAIRNAAQATGANFEYLLATAQVESGLNPNAMAATSSAGGLYQFIDQTWLGMLKDAGSSLGYDRLANAIVKSPSGQYEVSDSAIRREIMALRQDPTANAAMAGVFTQHNATALAAQLGRDPSEGELYVAHFLGSAGAAKLITAAENSPQSSAAALFPGAAAANQSIFYDKQGGARSASQVYGLLVQRYDVARAGTNGANVASNLPPRPPLDVGVAASFGNSGGSSGNNNSNNSGGNPPVVAFDPATFAAAQSTSATPVFHSLFRSEEHRGAVSPVVQELWGQANAAPVRAPSQPGTSPAGTASNSASTPAGPLSLYADQPANVRGLFGNNS
jgi:hypothetical protein